MRWVLLLVCVVGCTRGGPSPRTAQIPAMPLRVEVFQAGLDASLEGPLGQPTFSYEAYTAEVPTGFVFRPRSDRPELREWFRLRATGTFTITEPGVHLFYVTSDDGARVSIDGRRIVDNGPNLHTLQSVVGSVELAAGRHAIAVDYLQGPQLMELSLRCVRPDGTGGTFDTRLAW